MTKMNEKKGLKKNIEEKVVFNSINQERICNLIIGVGSELKGKICMSGLDNISSGKPFIIESSGKKIMEIEQGKRGNRSKYNIINIHPAYEKIVRKYLRK